MSNIIGKTIYLPNMRSVFVGRMEGEDRYYIQFKNGTAIQRFCLSQGAGMALLKLLSGEGGENASFEVGSDEDWRWQFVREIDA